MATEAPRDPYNASGPQHVIPVAFEVYAATEDEAATLLAERLQPVNGERVESWAMPNHPHIDGSDGDDRLRWVDTKAHDHPAPAITATLSIATQPAKDHAGNLLFTLPLGEYDVFCDSRGSQPRSVLFGLSLVPVTGAVNRSDVQHSALYLDATKEQVEGLIAQLQRVVDDNASAWADEPE